MIPMCTTDIFFLYNIVCPWFDLAVEYGLVIASSTTVMWGQMYAIKAENQSFMISCSFSILGRMLYNYAVQELYDNRVVGGEYDLDFYRSGGFAKRSGTGIGWETQ